MLTIKQSWEIIKDKFIHIISVREIYVVPFKQGTGVMINGIIGLLIDKKGKVWSINGLAKEATGLDYCKKPNFLELENKIRRRNDNNDDCRKN